ncbi:RNA-binding domain-containing protein [Wallemia mellicola]|uniref:RNA-binding domain-containing protein n=1 Tax=Wallemia mellicola TaxID=1708541 RepID=A0A4T0NAZ9_9BASI|nr:RNA-binding domain-containing protein [Wallemia mellicola]TIB92105.1 RNA-binding domain-containing protein [Wallemia mellicola]TIB93855.1 RNA-binding domain-containing protein [Wallemia mellicola]TIC01199.1 RNA-binding domain-containing protein [Wallemia mellicola]TIC04697.1 RNA-binding domain-containing protein [Wallemia mellicola]
MSDSQMQLDGDAVNRKGRGFVDGRKNSSRPMEYERLEEGMSFDTKAAKSVEGWVVIVTNVHEEASEEDVQDKFADYGHIRNLHLNLDRRTGYVKGYALIEFENYEDAKKAIDESNGTELLEQAIQADFAFSKPPPGFEPDNDKKKNRRSASPARE